MLKAHNKENHELQASTSLSDKMNELPRVTMSCHDLPAKQKRIDLKIKSFSFYW